MFYPVFHIPHRLVCFMPMVKSLSLVKNLWCSVRHCKYFQYVSLYLVWCLEKERLILIISISMSEFVLHFSTIVSNTWFLESFTLEYKREQPFVFRFTNILSVLFSRECFTPQGSIFPIQIF